MLLSENKMQFLHFITKINEELDLARWRGIFNDRYCPSVRFDFFDFININVIIAVNAPKFGRFYKVYIHIFLISIKF